MKMTDLTIGEHYAWEKKRVKLLATGVVLKHYQHRGVQVEVAEGNTMQLLTLPARELTSTWEDYQQARAKWDREKQIATDQLRQMKCTVQGLQDAMDDLGLYNPPWITLNAWRGYATLTFENIEQVEKLTLALQSLWGFLEAENLLESLTDAGLH